MLLIVFFLHGWKFKPVKNCNESNELKARKSCSSWWRKSLFQFVSSLVVFQMEFLDPGNQIICFEQLLFTGYKLNAKWFPSSSLNPKKNEKCFKCRFSFFVHWVISQPFSSTFLFLAEHGGRRKRNYNARETLVVGCNQ